MTNEIIRKLINNHVSDELLKVKLLDLVEQEERHERWEAEKRRRGKIVSLDSDEYVRTKLEYEFRMHNEDTDIINEFDILDLLNSIKQLSKQDRSLIGMLYFKGMSEREVADKLGVSKNAIHKRKHKILKKLKKFYKKGDQSAISSPI